MKFIMNDAFKGASGKICEHSDMGASYNVRTGATYSHKRCNKRDLNALPYNEKEIAIQSNFKTRSAAISAVLKNLNDEQRKALTVLRNERGLFTYRQLVEEIYDKSTNSVPQESLNNLLAQAMKSASAPTGGGSSTPSGGGSTSGGGSGDGI